MKPMMASLLLGLSLVISSTIAHPAQRASADPFYCNSAPALAVTEVFTFGLGILACNDGLQAVSAIPSPSCPLSNVNVSGTASKHTYGYHFKCDAGSDVTVQAHFDITPLGGVGEETLSSFWGTATAHWACPEDPWISASSPAQLACVGGILSLTPGGPDPQNIDVANVQDGPLSVSVLSADARHTLATQLQNALNQQPANSGHVSLGQQVLTKVENLPSPTPAQPDLSVSISGKTSLYSGMTAPYTITIKNLGAPLSGNPNIQIAIAFGGKLQEYATSDTSAFTCTPGATINCTGHLDASGEATLTFQGWASAAGTGSVQATVDPTQSLPDSNRGNNTQTLNVTVS